MPTARCEVYIQVTLAVLEVDVAAHFSSLGIGLGGPRIPQPRKGHYRNHWSHRCCVRYRHTPLQIVVLQVHYSSCSVLPRRELGVVCQCRQAIQRRSWGQAVPSHLSFSNLEKNVKSKEVPLC
jgi:hypothetical protein